MAKSGDLWTISDNTERLLAYMRHTYTYAVIKLSTIFLFTTNKMAEILRTPAEEATRELYKLFHQNIYYRVKPEDVQRCIDNGAMLTGIKSSFGTPLTCAIENTCEISVIELLVKNGGLDADKDSIAICVLFESYPPDNYLELLQKYNKFVYDDICVEYVYIHSLMNTLVKMYNISTGSKKLKNQIIQAYPGLKKRPFISDDNDDMKNRHKESNDELYNYLKQVCDVLEIDFTSLYDRLWDLPEDLIDFDSACQDDAPYNWSPDIDGYSGTSSDEQIDNE